MACHPGEVPGIECQQIFKAVTGRKPGNEGMERTTLELIIPGLEAQIANLQVLTTALSLCQGRRLKMATSQKVRAARSFAPMSRLS